MKKQYYYGIKKYLFLKWCYSHYKAHPALNFEDTDLHSLLFFPAVSFSVSPTAHPVSLISLCSASLLLYAEHSVLWPASLCSEDPYREQREEEHDTSAFVTNTAGTCNTQILVEMTIKSHYSFDYTHMHAHTHTHTHTHVRTHSALIRAADWQNVFFGKLRLHWAHCPIMLLSLEHIAGESFKYFKQIMQVISAETHSQSTVSVAITPLCLIKEKLNITFTFLK